MLKCLPVFSEFEPSPFDFIKNRNSFIVIEIKNNEFIIKHTKYGGKIIISTDNKYNNGSRNIQFNCLQSNYSLIYFNLSENIS